MSLKRIAIDRWNALMDSLGMNTKEVARKAGVPEHKLRSMLSRRRLTEKEQEQHQIVDQVRKALPDEVGSTVDRVFAVSQSGDLGAEVIDRMRDEIKALAAENYRLNDENRRLEKKVQRLERKIAGGTTSTKRPTVRNR